MTRKELIEKIYLKLKRWEDSKIEKKAAEEVLREFEKALNIKIKRKT